MRKLITYLKTGRIAYLFLLLAIFFYLPVSCSKELAITETALGQKLSANGKIANESLTFIYDPKEAFSKNMDFFNFVYFEGDTLCFSFKLAKNLTEKQVAVYFINPITNTEFKAERVDITGKYVTGFSLTGTLLEQFFGDILELAFDSKRFINKDISFIVRIDITDDAEKDKPAISQTVESVFKIDLLNE